MDDEKNCFLKNYATNKIVSLLGATGPAVYT